MAAPTFAQLEELIGRLAIDQGNYWVFDKLLEQPYDVYRPIMDMLFDGTIVIEDLTVPAAVDTLSSTDDVSAARQRLTVNSSSLALGNRCAELLAGKRPGSVVITRDTSALAVAGDGSPGATYTPATSTAVGADSSEIAPNAIELARAGSLEEAQKAAQASLGAALEPKIG
jgi:hypothetical protein